MTRWIRAFGAFCYHFVIGDDWSVAVGVVAALTTTYGVAALAIPAWWVLPAVVVIVLPMSLWRVARTHLRSSSGP